MTSTLLSIKASGNELISPYSARGLSQTLEPIAQTAYARRTVNGELIDLSSTQFRKYRSVISCEDQRPPAFDALWPGQEVVVDCVAELSFLTAAGGPAKTAVSGSTYVEGSYTHYRPRLTMMVAAPWTAAFDEYGARIGWELVLEEV